MGGGSVEVRVRVGTPTNAQKSSAGSWAGLRVKFIRIERIVVRVVSQPCGQPAYPLALITY